MTTTDSARGPGPDTVIGAQTAELSRPVTTHAIDGRATATRRQILRAAAHQFARRAYYDVSLDDILAQAGLTKGAMYFHFHSKHALAVALIDQQTSQGAAAFQDLLSRGLSGLETLIDFSYLVAVRDMKTDGFRAALNLLESVGRSEGIQEGHLVKWIRTVAGVVERAIAEGDVGSHCDPEDVARLMVSLHMGLRQTSNLDAPGQFLRDHEKCWLLLLSGILKPDRSDYFRQFLARRSALAINANSSDAEPE